MGFPLPSRRITGVTPLLRISPTASSAYRSLAFVQLVDGFFPETNWLSQVPPLTLLVARRGLRPRHVFPHSPYRVVLFRLQMYENPGLRAVLSISRLNPFTRITADFLLHTGFTRIVTNSKCSV